MPEKVKTILKRIVFFLSLQRIYLRGRAGMTRKARYAHEDTGVRQFSFTLSNYIPLPPTSRTQHKKNRPPLGAVYLFIAKAELLLWGNLECEATTSCHPHLNLGCVVSALLLHAEVACKNM